MINPKEDKFQKIIGENNQMSKTQIELCNFIAYGVGNATVQSRAGSGKSKTIELMCAAINPRKKILIISHNNHIAKHLQKKLKDKENIDVCTYHSLGFKILKTKFKNIELKEDKYFDYLTHNLDELSGNAWSLLSSPQRRRYKTNIIKLLDFSRYNEAQSVKEILKVANKYGLQLINNECDVVRKMLQWGSTNIEKIDFQDMIWLPYELGIKANIKFLQYDVIFVDEAQDSSLIQQNLIDICKNRATRFVLFGDSFQTINSWCGADTEAFEKFEKLDNMREFHLSVSYRCSKRVADKVRQIVPDFETPDFAKEGEVNYNTHISEIKEGDLVLCRLTAPLVKLHMKLLSDNKPSKVTGLAIGRELISILNEYKTDNINEIINQLYIGLFDTWDSIAKINQCSLKDVVCEPLIMEEYDKILAIQAVSEGITNKQEVINRLNDIFVSDIETDDNDVITNDLIHLSTVHRAKGLECDNVFILCPSLMPSKLARVEWEIESEKNIVYVAWSRAKNTLNFISEQEFPPENGYSGIDDMYNELIKLKAIYCK